MKKNWKTLAFLVVLLLGLGGLATWDEWKGKQEEKDKETSNRVVVLKAEDVTGLVFHSNGEAEPVEGDKTAASPSVPGKSVDVALKLVEGKWMISAPVSEPADQQVVQDLLKNLLDYKYEKEITSGKDQWPQFGLVEPRRRVEIETKDGAKTVVLVGINAPVGYSVYSATDKSDKVFAGSQYISTSLAKSLFDFRDKKVLAINGADLAGFELQKGKDKPLVLSRKDGKWSITSPEAVEADTAQVNNLIDDIGGLKVAEFVDAPSVDQVKAFEPGKLFATARFTDGKGASQVIKVAEAKGALFAAFDPAKKIMKLGEDARAKLSKTLNDVRNKKIFDFQSAQVDGVEIDGKKFSRVKDEWYTSEDAGKFAPDGTFKGKEAEKPAPKAHVRGLLVDLEYAKAEEVLTPDSASVKKLPPAPKNRITLNIAQGTVRKPVTIDVWLAGENPEQIYLRPSDGAKVFKAKRSVIASLSESQALPAEDAKFPLEDVPPPPPVGP